MIYLICFDKPYKHAKHYIGFVDTSTRDPEVALATRLDYHAKGKGSRLLRAVNEAGINWKVTRTWENGSRDGERRLKQHSATRYCPRCSPDTAMQQGTLRVRRDSRTISYLDSLALQPA